MVDHKVNVSVIIPTRNREEMLKRALYSVLNQSELPNEVIIIDDGSDPPVSINDFNLRPPEINLKLIRNDKSQGANNARNQGAAEASQDILMFLDDDDTWESKKIAAQLKIIESDPRIGLVYSGRLVVHEDNRDKILYKIAPKSEGDLFPSILFNNLIGTTSSVALKKSLFIEVGGFDENIPSLQDYDLWIRCCKKTIIGHDGSFNVRYTVANSPHKQISGQLSPHIEAAQQIMSKYDTDISCQGFFRVRQIRSSLYFLVAKAARRDGIIYAMPWIMRSLYSFPRLKTIALALPGSVISWFRKFRLSV